MNRKGRNQVKAAKSITYQEAWNKVCEYMNGQPNLSFFVDCWDKSGNEKYCLNRIDNNKEYEILFQGDRRMK